MSLTMKGRAAGCYRLRKCGRDVVAVTVTSGSVNVATVSVVAGLWLVANGCWRVGDDY